MDRLSHTSSDTNLDYPDWNSLFQNKPLVDALLDRQQHHRITIRINSPSLRDLEHASSTISKPAPSPQSRQSRMNASWSNFCDATMA